MSAIADMTAVELARAIRERQVSPTEAVRAALARIDACAELNAFITVTADAALAAAEVAEQRVMAGEALPPLHGVPYSVKDLTSTAGVRTTMGSAIFENYVPTEDAIAVARAKAAGAILIGKTTTPEFGHKQLTEAPIFGLTLNPIDRTVTCGASSGGAAVAVATGMGPLALGTDGGGSIRIPAACCGIVGMKATLGVVPHLQAPDLFAANSFTGPMARDVADTALLFGIIAGFDRRDPYGQATAPDATRGSLAGLRVGWMARCGNRLLDREVEAATTGAVKLMEQAGAVVEPIEIDFVALERHFLVILESGIAARVGPHVERFRDRLDPHLITTIEKGRLHSAIALHEAGAARSAMFRRLQEAFERFDVIVSPVLAAPPPPLDARLPDGPVLIEGEESGAIRGGLYPYTFPVNLTGHPALSMPCGVTARGLPIGLQIIGRWHADRFLLDVALQLETRLREQSPLTRGGRPVVGHWRPLPQG
jgi:aspartyl-tRNA(Asn)/glutamyl-tRNA(Gln) amidotransferase subunit A